MSYTPTTWAAGDTITSAKLNKLEQGIRNNSSWIIPIIEIENEVEDDENTIVQKGQNSGSEIYSYQLGDGTITYKMIEDALNAGQMVFFKILSVEGDSPFSVNTNIYTTIGTAAINYNNEELGYQVVSLQENDIAFGAATKTEPLVYHWMPAIVPDEPDPSSEDK